MGNLSGGNAEMGASIKKLARHCDDKLDLKTARLNDEYFYQSLPLCVIDSIYSIGVKYESTRNTVARYCDYYGHRKNEYHQ